MSETRMQLVDGDLTLELTARSEALQDTFHNSRLHTAVIVSLLREFDYDSWIKHEGEISYYDYYSAVLGAIAHHISIAFFETGKKPASEILKELIDELSAAGYLDTLLPEDPKELDF